MRQGDAARDSLRREKKKKMGPDRDCILTACIS